MRLIPHISSLSDPLGSLFRQDHKPEALRSLINLYISSWDFDEAWYLSRYDDLGSAIPSEDFPCGRKHFTEVGYYEGRLPVQPRVDTDWYMSTYADVAAAIIGGTFADAHQHYTAVGYLEGRLPCDPGVQPAWYAPRYMRTDAQAAADVRACTDHFITFGYLNGALPAPPR